MRNQSQGCERVGNTGASTANFQSADEGGIGSKDKGAGVEGADVLNGAAHHEAAKMLLAVNEDDNFVHRASRWPVFVIGQTAGVARLLTTASPGERRAGLLFKQITDTHTRMSLFGLALY